MFLWDAVRLWLRDQGQALIKEHNDAITGQGVLRLVPQVKRKSRCASSSPAVQAPERPRNEGLVRMNAPVQITTSPPIGATSSVSIVATSSRRSASSCAILSCRRGYGTRKFGRRFRQSARSP
jgi:hypothetical protein